MNTTDINKNLTAPSVTIAPRNPAKGVLNFVVILGQYQSHVAVARALRLPLPGPGESVSARITPAQRPGAGVAEIAGKHWKIAKPGDPIVPAPVLPEI